MASYKPTKKKEPSQRELVQKRLEEGKSISSDYAFEHFEIKSLGPIIQRIKKKYPKIIVTSVIGSSGKPINSYKLHEDDISL